MKTALLIANGGGITSAFIKKCAKDAAFIIAADGGANFALKAGITPDAVLGDMDSVLPFPPNKKKKPRLIKVESQNNTDFEKCLNYLAGHGFKKCIVTGAFGKRPDFSVANFLSCYPYLKTMDIVFKSPLWSIYPVIKGREFPSGKGGTVSLIPLTPCKKVNLENVVYRLKNADIGFEVNAGYTLSNKTLGGSFVLSFSKGFMLVYTA